MNFLYSYTSIGVLLLPVLLFLAWRAVKARQWRAVAIMLAALILWVPFEYSRPFVGHGYVTGTEVRRIPNPGQPAATDDVDFIYMKGWGGDSQFRNEDTLLFLKWNTDDVYGYAKSIEGKPEQTRTFIATGVRNYVLSWHPNMISLRPTLAWVMFVLHYAVWVVVFGFLLVLYGRARREGAEAPS